MREKAGYPSHEPNMYPEAIGTLFQSFPLMVHKTEIFLCNDHEVGSLYFSLGVFTFETLRYATLQTDDRRSLSGS